MAAGPTYEPIATSTVSGTSTTTIALASIPSTYTDLVLVADITTTNNNNGNGWITFNSDTGSNYSQTRLYGGNITGSDKQTSANYINLNIGGYNNGIITTVSINNYSSTNAYKSTITRISNPSQYVGLNIGLWRSTNAISRIDVTIHEGYMNEGSTVTLYGIKAA
jgi:hypothetical protein